MKRLLLATILAAGVWPVAARAAPYWVAWEGNDYPENEGWERQYLNGGAQRTLGDGALRLDSASHLGIDQYSIERAINPGFQTFVAEWRVRVNQSTGPIWDQGVAIATDQNGLLMVGLYRSSIVSYAEGWTFHFEPDQFHEFRIESSDMSSYLLLVDGEVAVNGFFEPNTLVSRLVVFGDRFSGGGVTSSAEWDYFRFGVVPEPSTIAFFVSLLAVYQNRRMK